MLCPKCNAEIDDSSTSCPQCGAPINTDNIPVKDSDIDDILKITKKTPAAEIEISSEPEPESEPELEPAPEPKKSSANKLLLILGCAVIIIIPSIFFMPTLIDKFSSDDDSEIVEPELIMLDESVVEPECAEPDQLECEGCMDDEFIDDVPQYVMITGEHVRLRTSPSTAGNDNIILNGDGVPLYPDKGEKFEYLGEVGDFYQIRTYEYCPEPYAYVSKQFATCIY
ncbi:MAG: zinc-ribbon domain-containing protein [Muribaculaceae bacterium]